MSFSTAELFDNPEYSDLTIKFSDTEIRCHKLILCTNSDYFKKLCGPSSHFAEKDQSTIELKGDDPLALRATLQYLYTKNHQNADTNSDWRLQLEIWKAANKYLVPHLAESALSKFQQHTLGLKEPSEVFGAIMHIREAAEGVPAPLTIADRLEKREALALLEEPSYREHLEEEDSEAMWKHLDDLRDFKSSLVQVELVWCKNGCEGARKAVQPGETVVKGCRSGCDSEHSLNSAIVWVSADQQDQVLKDFLKSPNPVTNPSASQSPWSSASPSGPFGPQPRPGPFAIPPSTASTATSFRLTSSAERMLAYGRASEQSPNV